ncbi:GntR family transcriptional regulator [Nisaea sp.]|uniref:FadR/GntR family transcriptional regulator n=1 Tax=Nisaea sp. TaxID=2024842 RepID=UPI00326752F2
MKAALSEKALRSGHAQNLGGSVVEDLVSGIRKLIDSRGLVVGDKLPSERELCDLFSTSRNTVREAMRMLKAYGIVEVRPKIGAVIIDQRMERVFDLFSFNTIEVSRESFADVQGFRSLLEVTSVDRLLEQIGDADIEEMTQVNTAMRDADDFEEASEFDFRFHIRLMSVLGNRSALDVYRIMKPVIIKIMVLGKSNRDGRSAAYDQHAAVIGALEVRDRIAYQFHAQSHLNFGLENFRSYFAGCSAEG